MSSHTHTESERLESFQSEYRRAWQCFTVAVEELQTVMSDAASDHEIIAAARRRVEVTVRDYREARNKLAECLLEEEAARQEAVGDSTETARLARSRAA